MEEDITKKKYFNNIDEAIKVYTELRRLKNGDFIGTIDPDFFFNLMDCILKRNKELEEEVNNREDSHMNLYNEFKHYKQYESIPISVIQNKITEEIKYHEKNISDIKNITMFVNKTDREQAEIKFNEYAINILNKLLEKVLEEGKK